MVKIAESKRGTHIAPGLFTGKHTIKLHGSNDELNKVVREIENVIKKHTNDHVQPRLD